MPDKDLRRQVLGSGKTVSRKAKSKQASRDSSRANSTPNSRPASRNASRQPSDEEDSGSVSDGTAWSINSIDELLAGEPDEDLDPLAWQSDLNDRIEELINRKRSSVQGREDCLASYIHILTAHYAAKEIAGKTPDLLQAFGKSIKTESSERETILALKALALTVITTPEDHYYDLTSTILKRTINDSTSLATKAAAIHCLGTCTFFGGAGDDEILEEMVYLLDIVSSDGNSIEAPDDAATVMAALEEWGFLATELDDLKAYSEEMIETLAEQLDSNDTGVQVAAGENIALLYEKSYFDRPDDESDGEGTPADQPSFSDEEDTTSVSGDENEGNPPGHQPRQRYSPYHNTPLLLTKLSSLATLSTHKISKKSKRTLHTSMASILTTVRNPLLGPRYRTAENNETGNSYGNRMTVRIHRHGEMKVDRWWKWMRLGALRRVLQGGFVTHYFEGNAAVLDSLPIIIVQKDDSKTGTRSPKPGKANSKGRGGRMKAFED